MKNSILFTTIIATTIFSCKDKQKDQPVPAPALSAKQTLLIGKDWKFDKMFSEGNDVSSMLPACVKDNIMYHFTDASKGYYDEGATKCEPTDPQKENFTWKLENNETRLITTSPESKDTFQVLNVSATELKLGADNVEITLKK